MSFDRDQIRSIAITFVVGTDYGGSKRSKTRPLLLLSVFRASCSRTHRYRVSCYAANIPYRSVVGFAFLGRLKFLAALPVEERNQVLDKASKNTNSADVKKVISLLRNEFSGGTAKWDIGAFKKRAQASLFPPEGDLAQQQRFYHALNGMVAAFLLPPAKILLSAVATDFKTSQRITIPEVVGFLFVTTRFYFSHRDVMPQCASLITFRNQERRTDFRHFQKSLLFPPSKETYLPCSFDFLAGVPVLLGSNREAAASETLPISVRMLAALTVLGAIDDARELPFSGIPAALYASNVGANDRLTGCHIGRNCGLFVFSITSCAFSET